LYPVKVCNCGVASPKILNDIIVRRTHCECVRSSTASEDVVFLVGTETVKVIIATIAYESVVTCATPYSESF
jgi:hypothetical protein